MVNNKQCNKPLWLRLGKHLDHIMLHSRLRGSSRVEKEYTKKEGQSNRNDGKKKREKPTILHCLLNMT